MSTPRIESCCFQNSSVACTMALLKVVTECMNPAKIGWIALVLLFDKSQCQGHVPVGLGCKFLDEYDDLCMPPPLSLQAALISPPLCIPPLSKLSHGKMSSQALSMFSPQLSDCADRLISVVREPVTVSPLPLMGIETCPAIVFGENCPDL